MRNGRVDSAGWGDDLRRLGMMMVCAALRLGRMRPGWCTHHGWMMRRNVWRMNVVVMMVVGRPIHFPGPLGRGRCMVVWASCHPFKIAHLAHNAVVLEPPLLHFRLQFCDAITLSLTAGCCAFAVALAALLAPPNRSLFLGHGNIRVVFHLGFLGNFSRLANAFHNRVGMWNINRILGLGVTRDFALALRRRLLDGGRRSCRFGLRFVVCDGLVKTFAGVGVLDRRNHSLVRGTNAIINDSG
mmetsp:Transcript_24933/g.58525  ORF Transcript_24933/g.58525 Transcript_24933/m.58525 type:complete len:242 (+) Transcript_24933:586-1311(+)